jgi:hypothetical protein
MSAETYCVVYIIERKFPRQRRFYPAISQGVFDKKRNAVNLLKTLQKSYPHNEYRVTGYWDKRPW